MQLKNKNTRQLKISLCTTCMNRLEHLEETLPLNVFANRAYENLEFLILDYNSQHAILPYLQNNFPEQLISGRLKYYRTDYPRWYSMSHSRNLAFKLGTGDILCNIDADNFTGEGFADFVNKKFLNNEKIFLSTHTVSQKKSDVLGRLCVDRRDFMEVRGYDEAMKYYGFDDYDLILRLQANGLKMIGIIDPKYLVTLKHSDELRLKNFEHANHLAMLLIKHVTPFESLLVYCFEDGSFVSGSIVNVYASKVQKSILGSAFKFILKEKTWSQGKWKLLHNNNLSLSLGEVERVLVPKWENQFVFEKTKQSEIYHHIKSKSIIASAQMFFSQISNRLIMEGNSTSNLLINPDSFGVGEVIDSTGKLIKLL